jgi:selenocysteine-specific elongation factor
VKLECDQIRNLVIGTAGHVDHGKTSLVRALTGMETDRWEEEKIRGITIDIGFANRELPDGRRVGFIDVPGHERFVRHMIAGAAGVDLVLLVVAADDGVMPQTREHLDILRFLGVTNGVVALTKIDIDPDLAELAAEEVETFLSGTFLEGAPVLPVSSVTGEGIDELWNVLAERIVAAEAKTIDGLFRMPVQRVFTLEGFGAIMTGVPVSGAARQGDLVDVLPRGGRGRIRSIQAYFRDVEEARAGHSTGLNISDIDTAACHRGQVVVPPDTYEPSDLVDVRLRLLDSAARTLETGHEVRFHTGTAEVLARLVVLDGPRIEPGMESLVQLRLASAVVFDRLDRFVVRWPSPAVTIGGGTIIGSGHRFLRSKRRLREHVAAREVAAQSDESFVERLIETADGGCLRGDELRHRALLLPARTDQIIEGLVEAGRVRSFPPGPSHAHIASIERATEGLRRALMQLKNKRPDLPGLNTKAAAEDLAVSPALFDFVVAEGVRDAWLARSGVVVRLSSHTPTLGADVPLGRDVMSAIEQGRFSPPGFDDLVRTLRVKEPRLRRVCEFLVRSGDLIEVTSGIYFHAEIVSEAREFAKTELRSSGSLDTQALKRFMGASRKYLVPMLEYFDKTRVTRRDGDVRVAGEAVRDEPESTR